MRVNILTQPLFCNYGGILQNYALQTVLRRLGHDPLTVNVPTPMPGKPVLWKNAVKGCINFGLRLGGCYPFPFLNPYKFSCKEHELSFPQREFVAKYIKKVDHTAPFTSRILDELPAEAWIVGSDQVWRPWCSRFIENNFFDFIPQGCGVKKIAYATSFGTDKWEISPELTPKIHRLARDFDAISVREESGVGLCEKYFGVEAVHMPDPTMLLFAEDYLTLTEPADHPEGDYIASYILDMDISKRRAIKSLMSKASLPVSFVGVMHSTQFDSVERWLASIAFAKYVVTDSFHGTVFSIIFGRPVRILGNRVRGNSRIESLLRMLGLKPDADQFIRVGAEHRARLASLRDGALTYLKCSLENKPFNK